MSRNMRTWKSDGSGWRARIGVLTPDDDTVPDAETAVRGILPATTSRGNDTRVSRRKHPTDR